MMYCFPALMIIDDRQDRQAFDESTYPDLDGLVLEKL